MCTQYVAACASKRLPACCQSLTAINPSLIREGLIACPYECVRSDICVRLKVHTRASHTPHVCHAHTTIPSCKHRACTTIYRALATPNRRKAHGVRTAGSHVLSRFPVLHGLALSLLWARQQRQQDYCWNVDHHRLFTHWRKKTNTHDHSLHTGFTAVLVVLAAIAVGLTSLIHGLPPGLAASSRLHGRAASIPNGLAAVAISLTSLTLGLALALFGLAAAAAAIGPAAHRLA